MSSPDDWAGMSGGQHCVGRETMSEMTTHVVDSELDSKIDLGGRPYSPPSRSLPSARHKCRLASSVCRRMPAQRGAEACSWARGNVLAHRSTSPGFPAGTSALAILAWQYSRCPR